MANHGFISSRKHFKEEQVLQDLQEINQRRFKGLLKIEDSDYGSNGAWFISYLDPTWKNSVGFNIWIRSKRMLEHRHSSHPWVTYLEIAFSEELATKYKGLLSDDGVQEKWKPNKKKYSSFRKWLSVKFDHIKDVDQSFVDKFVKSELSCAPEILKDL